MPAESLPSKHSPSRKVSRLAKAFDGWQLGLALVGASLLVVLIVVPRPQMPNEIPHPTPNMAILHELAERDAIWAREVQHRGLPFETRQVGETFRMFGVAAAAQEASIAETLLGEMRTQIRAVRDTDSLLRLRAYQTQDFLRELEAFESTGVASRGLDELGGEFVAMARTAGWLAQKGPREQLLADQPTRRALFRKRWADILHLPADKFGVTLDEERAIHAFLFLHPVAREQRNCLAANEVLLRRVTAFGTKDETYPTDYARGLLLLRLDRPEAAVEPLARFLETHPNGPYTLHARNALRHAQARTFSLLQMTR